MVDETIPRREFLKGAMVGTAALAAGTAAPAAAQTPASVTPSADTEPQLALNPREFFRAGIESANVWTRKTYGKDFDRLSEQDREAALKAMEDGKAPFPGFSSRMFFDALLQITMEGFFADPIYGGNRDMAGWKMVGYPGLPATYREEITKYFGKKYDKPPRSIADFS